eukprot:CAMPEP_0170610364 /NCGR_PEP_ID=MMETSP0224-20130122/22621_1 /TAXON_ID=285029 /ORGANISM="Togula jolla, Strain CCCM 725" /LENGTH=176 /DNA_ID=CAMNT_0010935737 /DNA_START=65 /DNA_END=595 /DNA_ORIENTATION=-
MTGRLAVAVTGALVVQLPLLLIHLNAAPSGAAWGWAASGPMCTFAHGTCGEAETVAADSSCAPVCADANQVPSSSDELPCPASTGTSDDVWWTTCGPGASCAANMPLGTDITCSAASNSTSTSPMNSSAASMDSTAPMSSTTAAADPATTQVASGATVALQSGMALMAVLAAASMS